jgi:hypothetical protein
MVMEEEKGEKNKVKEWEEKKEGGEEAGKSKME